MLRIIRAKQLADLYAELHRLRECTRGLRDDAQAAITRAALLEQQLAMIGDPLMLAPPECVSATHHLLRWVNAWMIVRLDNRTLSWLSKTLGALSGVFQFELDRREGKTTALG